MRLLKKWTPYLVIFEIKLDMELQKRSSTVCWYWQPPSWGDYFANMMNLKNGIYWSILTLSEIFSIYCPLFIIASLNCLICCTLYNNHHVDQKHLEVSPKNVFNITYDQLYTKSFIKNIILYLYVTFHSSFTCSRSKSLNCHVLCWAT